MSAPKHTLRAIRIAVKGRGEEADIVFRLEGAPESTVRVPERVAAAAPELLQACEDVSEALENIGVLDDVRSMARRLRAVIAKAEGK